MRRPVMAATIIEARYPMPDPMGEQDQTTSVHPEITNGAVLRDAGPKAGPLIAVERLAREPFPHLCAVVVSDQRDGS